MPGEYVINLHYYASETQKPVKVSVKLAKVNPALEILYYGTEVLEKKGDERTALRFAIGAGGTVSDISHLQKRLVILG